MPRNIVFALLLFFSLPAFAAAGYSSAIEDLPLMPTMSEKPDEAVSFDTAGGRIIETAAETPALPSDIESFYATALPPLGWQPLSKTDFARDGEILSFKAERKDGITRVHFSLRPKE